MKLDTSSESKGITLPAFGAIEPERVIAQDDLWVVITDKYPVSAGHTLIIPQRQVLLFGELSTEEMGGLMKWINWVQKHWKKNLIPPPQAFNLGVNDGKAAGQTMPQFHFHVIPRYAGDVPDPRGGIRWVISEKAKYWN